MVRFLHLLSYSFVENLCSSNVIASFHALLFLFFPCSVLSCLIYWKFLTMCNPFSISIKYDWLQSSCRLCLILCRTFYQEHCHNIELMKMLSSTKLKVIRIYIVSNLWAVDLFFNFEAPFNGLAKIWFNFCGHV